MNKDKLIDEALSVRDPLDVALKGVAFSGTPAHHAVFDDPVDTSCAQADDVSDDLLVFADIITTPNKMDIVAVQIDLANMALEALDGEVCSVLVETPGQMAEIYASALQLWERVMSIKGIADVIPPVQQTLPLD